MQPCRPKIRDAVALVVALFAANLSLSRGASAELPVPRGEVTAHRFAESKVFPGTVRDYWIYVPRQYDGAKPACVFIGQDGIQFDAPAVFDRLIAAGDLPVTIGVFVQPGRLPSLGDSTAARLNRSFEYDGLGDGYARFLLDELLPDVGTKMTADGRAIRLSPQGNDRAIAGLDAGGICAFTAAWERPDAFSRVFSAAGAFVGVRGGHAYPMFVRKFEPKPVRVFLAAGSGDAGSVGGDLWLANQEMERALAFAGYDARHAWHDGGTDEQQARRIFPEAMKWLWREWPAKIANGAGSRELQEILLPGQGWQLVGEGYAFTEGPAADRDGDFFFNDIPNNKTYHVGRDGRPVVINSTTNGSNGMVFGADGRRYVASTGTKQLLAFDRENHATVLAENLPANDVAVRSNGDVYLTNPVSKHDPGTVWLVRPGGEKRLVDSGLIFPNGVTTSPDQSLLYVAEFHSHWVWRYQIQPDGSLAHKQRYFHLQVADNSDASGADGMRCDRDGRLYVATRMGIQVCDPEGRMIGILTTPNGKSVNLCFGGPNFDELYATCADKVFKRKVRVTGAHAWDIVAVPRQ